MPQTDQILDELLEDAKLVSRHGVRAGSFASDQPIFQAIEQAEAAKALGTFSWSAPEVAKLQAALTAAIRNIQPVTLYDLKTGWRVDVGGKLGESKTNQSWGITKVSVLVATVVVMLFSAYLTVWQQQASRAINNIQNAKLADERAALEGLLSLVASLDEPANRTGIVDPSSEVSVGLRQKQEEIKAIEASIRADERIFNDRLADYVRYMQFDDQLIAFGKGGINLIEQAIWETGPAMGMLNARETGQVSYANAETPVAETGPVSVGDCVRSAGIEAINDRLGAASSNELSLLDAAVERDAFLQDRISCFLGLDSKKLAIFSITPYDVKWMVDKVEFASAWLLPGLYGMLGALIYHLRLYLNNFRPDPKILKVTLRVMLGGFAGVAIGTIWQPVGGEALGVPAIRITPLTIAFLMGYSIDVFLALLDRIVTLMHRWVGGLGATS